MITPPTPLEPPQDGCTRHQYLLAIDTPTWDKIDMTEKFDKIIGHFGLMGMLYLELVREDSQWMVWHHTVDIPDEL